MFPRFRRPQPLVGWERHEFSMDSPGMNSCGGWQLSQASIRAATAGQVSGASARAAQPGNARVQYCTTFSCCFSMFSLDAQVLYFALSPHRQLQQRSGPARAPRLCGQGTGALASALLRSQPARAPPLLEMDSLGPRYSGSGDIGYGFVDFRGPKYRGS